MQKDVEGGYVYWNPKEGERELPLGDPFTTVITLGPDVPVEHQAIQCRGKLRSEVTALDQ